MSELIIDEFIGICSGVRVVPSEEEIRADERKKVIASIRVGLGKVQKFELETSDNYISFNYYKAEKVLELLSEVAKGGKAEECVID